MTSFESGRKISHQYYWAEIKAKGGSKAIDVSLSGGNRQCIVRSRAKEVKVLMTESNISIVCGCLLPFMITVLLTISTYDNKSPSTLVNVI
jgi:hypothetical protein